jgi:hypothetical protein
MDVRDHRSMMLLRMAYLANVLILLPVALATLLSARGAAAVIESKFPVDTPYRILVGCLWSGILMCSILGLFSPQRMVGIVILQVIYKALFLGIVIFPLWKSKGMDAVPMGLSLSFLVIVLVWPWVLWQTFPWR